MATVSSVEKFVDMSVDRRGHESTAPPCRTSSRTGILAPLVPLVPLVATLRVPSLPRVVADGVFDAWGWCESDVLEWRYPARAPARGTDATDSRNSANDANGANGASPSGLVAAARACPACPLGDDAPDAPMDATNPSDLAFVMHSECIFLPRELACLHARGYGLDDRTWALAPYAIDDATDQLYERRVRPRDVLWLAAPSLPALFWGLHDWVHFHNHGPFDEPAMTELQCDLVALAWLRLNQQVVGITDARIARLALELAGLSRWRFATERRSPPVADLERLFASPYPSAPLATR